MMRMSDAAQIDVGAAIAEMQRMLGMATTQTEEQVREEEPRPGISFAEFKRDKWKAWTQDGNASPSKKWLTDGTILLKASALQRKPPYKSMTEGAANGKVRIEAIEHLFNGAKEEKAERWRGTRDEWVIRCEGINTVLLMSPGGFQPPVPICPSKAKLIEQLIPGVEYWCKLNDGAAPIHLQVDGELVGLLMPLRVDNKPKAWSGVTEVKAAYQGRVKV